MKAPAVHQAAGADVSRGDGHHAVAWGAHDRDGHRGCRRWARMIAMAISQSGQEAISQLER